MTRTELILSMVRHGALRRDAEDRFQETLGTLGATLARAWSAEIPGVGTFVARGTTRPARQGINPFTRMPIIFPAKRICRIRFEPDPDLVDAINLDEPETAPSSDPLHLAFVSALTSQRREVVLAGIGRFYAIKRPALRARTNPRTGVVTPATPAHRSVRFSPASMLKAQAFPRGGEDDDDEG